MVTDDCECNGNYAAAGNPTQASGQEQGDIVRGNDSRRQRKCKYPQADLDNALFAKVIPDAAEHWLRQGIGESIGRG